MSKFAADDVFTIGCFRRQNIARERIINPTVIPGTVIRIIR